MKYLLDENGHAILLSSGSIDRFRSRDFNGRLRSNAATLQDLIETHGYVEVCIGRPRSRNGVPPSPTSVRLNISRLHDKAYSILLHFLHHDMEHRLPVEIAWIDDDLRIWSSSNHFETGGQAIEWLERHAKSEADPRLVSAPCADGRLEIEAPAFIELETLWRNQRGNFNAKVMATLDRLQLSGLYNIQRTDAFGVLRIFEAGRGYKYGARNAGFDQAAGRSLLEHPDPEYGRFVIADYEEALLSKRPISSVIDVYIHDPDGHDPNKLRLSEYLRLILPWKAVNDGYFVMGTSIRVPGRGLRPGMSRWHLLARSLKSGMAHGMMANAIPGEGGLATGLTGSRIFQ